MSTQIQTQKKSVKRTFWAVAIFYALIAFEFFYMASPFAIYFYSVYRPSLNLVDQYPGVAWLVSFFLPHIVIQTSSPIVNSHNVVGAILATVGFLAFCIGAGQVYYHKLARKGAVTGGVYNFIRHPQYAAFALCSFGLLILWPRYIVLVMFITMLFAYYFLAKVEEKECEEKFGQSYIDYKNKTHMFLPFGIPFAKNLPKLPESKVGKVVSVIALYVFALATAFVLARGLHSLALNSLYAFYTDDAAYIAVSRIEPETIEQLAEIALSNEDVQVQLADGTSDPNAKFINYVLPAEWHVSEIPMNDVEGATGHHLPSDYNRNLYKIVFTQADLRTNQDVDSRSLLVNVIKRTPVAEVWLNLEQEEVIDIQDPPETIMYENVPVPVY